MESESSNNSNNNGGKQTTNTVGIKFPKEWGNPPAKVVGPFVKLPGDYGMGY